MDPLVMMIIGSSAGTGVTRYSHSTTSLRVDAAPGPNATGPANVRRRAKITGHSQTMWFDVPADTYSVRSVQDVDHQATDNAHLECEPHKAAIETADS